MPGVVIWANVIFLSVLDRSIKIDCPDRRVAPLLKAVFAPFISRARRPIHFHCRIEPAAHGRGFVYVRNARRRNARTLADLLFLFDKDLTIDLQKQRHDLFFVHAGVIEYRRSMIAFVAPSGTGKSTTVWALLCAGLKYAGDELLPVDVDTLQVSPYPRALCLKTAPSAPYGLPSTTLDTDGLFYIPTRTFKKAPSTKPRPLRTVFFLNRIPGSSHRARIRSLDTAEAGARLYANALNALAHEGLGLDAAISVAARVRCYELQAGTLPDTVTAVRRFLSKAP